MTCKCTYLAGEDVLPKHSLLYSKYNVLNEINKIAVNGVPISVEIKQDIYNDLFVGSSQRVTKKRIREYLKSKGVIGEQDDISGVDATVKSSLRSYHDFKRLIDSGILSEKDAEDIIERITVTTDKARLRKWLANTFCALSDADVKYISGLGYKDYGRLSRKLLEETFEIDKKTGEVSEDRNIITRLWETNDNLMQLLGSKYGYFAYIEQLNSEFYGTHELTLDDRLKDMYLSPGVKRAVIRTLDIVK